MSLDSAGENPPQKIPSDDLERGRAEAGESEIRESNSGSSADDAGSPEAGSPEAGSPEDERALAQSFVDSGLVTAGQLKTGLEYQDSLGGRLPDILLKLGFVSERDLNQLLAKRDRMRSIDDLGPYHLDEALLKRIPRRVIEKHVAVPLAVEGDVVLLAVSDTTDFQVAEEFRFLTNTRVETVLAPRSQILERIARFYESNTPEEPQPLSERLVEGIADPTVAALARLLVEKGVINPSEWARELESYE